MGIKKKMTAWFLVLVMVCSMFVGVPVSATEGDAGGQEESVTGLAFADNMNWNEGIPTLSDEAQFSNEMWITPNSSREIVLAYNGKTIPTSDSASITVTKNDEVVNNVISAYGEESPDLWRVSFTDLGEYTIKYDAEGVTENNTVTVHVELPEVGFYTSMDRSEESIVHNNEFVFSDSDVDNVFYLILYAGECEIALDGERPFEATIYEDGDRKITDAETLKEYFTCDPVKDENNEVIAGTYKITVSSKKDFGLDVKAVVQEDANNRDTYGYINIRYHQPMDGLVTKDWIDWNNAGPFVNTSAEFSKEVGANVKEDKLFYFAYLSEEDGEETKITADKLTVTRANGEEEEIVVQTCAENGDLVMIQFPDAAEYIVTYTGEGNKDKSITVHVGYPEVGFYTSATQSPGSILANNCFVYTDLEKEDSKKFYLILKSDNDIELQEESPFVVTTYDEASDTEVKIEDVDIIKEQYIDVNKLEDISGVYELTVKADKSFGFEVKTQIKDGEGHSWEDIRHIDVRYVETGLVFGDPIWDDNGLTGELWDGSYAKYMEGEICSVRWVYLGVTEDGENYTAVDPSAFEEDTENPNEQLKINGATDYIIKSSDEGPFSADNDTVIIKDELAAKGIYGFYMSDNIDITYGGETITITKNLPTIGFYKANEASFDNFISNDYFMSETEMFEGMPIYVLPRSDVKNYSYTLDTIDKTILINDEEFVYTHISDDEQPAGYYQSGSSFSEPIKISVSKCAGSFLRLRGEINWAEGESEPFEQYLSLLYENKDAIILEDNSPHEGFAGCLISESDYKVSQWWQMSGDVYYWVHGKTIQDVVDQLSAVAEAGEVTVDGKTYPIGMTDYIWLNTSYFKYSEEFANSTQHVVTPSNIKGIIMQAEAEAPYALYDDGSKKGYYQVEEWVSGENTMLLTLPTMQPVEGEKLYYKVEKLSDEEAEKQQADYRVYDYENPVTIVEDENGNRRIKTAGYEDYVANVDKDGNATNLYPVFLPNLYVDATVEVKMMGNFGNEEAGKKVQLGFYEGSTNKSIINGKEFSAKDIGKVETVESAMIGSDEENIVTVTVTEFKASTECSKAPINGESCEVTLDGENADLRDKIDIYQKGDDDYADAKELAEGKPLKVKLDVKEAKEDDAEAKKVKEQVEKDCNKDKTKPSKVQYLDIDMKYQVGDRDPKAVTETMEEVDITMDIPDSFQQTGKHAKKRKYKVYRYHDGKVDMLEAEFDKDKKKLHFKTDKFSTYALVAEDVVPVSIEVSANPTKLSYVEGEMFDTTGMTISLVYSDGTKEIITGYTLSATSALVLTDKAVTVTYEGLTVQVPITVLEKPAATDPENDTPQVILPEVGETVTTANGSCKVTAIGLEGAVEVTFTPSKANKKAKKAKIDKKVTIDGKEYEVTAIAAGAFSGNTKMTSISIPTTVTKIGKNAFKGCTKLKKVTIPKNVTEIGSNAFYNCKKMTSVTTKGSSLTKIGTGAFRKCSSLKSVTITKNVTEIGKDAFSDCKKLSKVTINGTKLKKVGKNAFKNIAKKSTIKVPKSKKKAYKNLLKKAGYTKTVK